jgi:hypothetical protein
VGNTQVGLIGHPVLIINLKVKSTRQSAGQIVDQEVAGGRKGMKIKSVVLNLSSEETLRLTRILLDEDKDEALAFLKECLKSQLAEATRDH